MMRRRRPDQRIQIIRSIKAFERIHRFLSLLIWDLIYGTLLLCRVVRRGMVFGEVAIRIEARIEERLTLTYLYNAERREGGGIREVDIW
jgi:hypothetical protein